MIKCLAIWNRCRTRGPSSCLVLNGPGLSSSLVQEASFVMLTFRPMRRLDFRSSASWIRIPERAETLAGENGIPRTFRTVEEAVRFAPADAIFDLAVPASQFVSILPQLRDRAAVLMQKPMGETLEEAKRIREICRSKALVASVNFSLRYSPNNLAVRMLAEAGMMGEVHDIEVQIAASAPLPITPCSSS